MTNIFDKIVCLVLDRQLPEVTIHKELAAYGWEVEFFVAGDGITVSPDRYNYIDEKVEGRAQAWNYTKSLHAITTKARDEGWSNFLFCEADSVLTPKFERVWPVALAEINACYLAWDTLHLGSNIRNGINTKISDHIIQSTYTLDLHAVAFNWTMYDIILGIKPSAHATFDGQLADRQKRGMFLSYSIDPSIITQKAGWSHNENRHVDRSINHNL